jgi:hypothetical protein
MPNYVVRTLTWEDRVVLGYTTVAKTALKAEYQGKTYRDKALLAPYKEYLKLSLQGLRATFWIGVVVNSERLPRRLFTLTTAPEIYRDHTNPRMRVRLDKHDEKYVRYLDKLVNTEVVE